LCNTLGILRKLFYSWLSCVNERWSDKHNNYDRGVNSVGASNRKKISKSRN
jgi:hypothetical protein